MREVGLKENVIYPYFIDQAARCCLLEPVTRVDIAGEILGREQVEVWSFGGNAVRPERSTDRVPVRLGGRTLGFVDLARVFDWPG